MKSLKSLFGIAVLSLLLLSTSCQTQKKVKSPCTSRKYLTDSEYYRARDIGKSAREDVALKVARSGARDEIASIVKAHVMKVTDDYLKQREEDFNEELKSDFIERCITVVDQVLYNSYSICEEGLQNRKTKQYSYFVVIELSKKDYLKALEAEMKDEKNLKFDFEKEEFNKVFDRYIN